MEEQMADEPKPNVESGQASLWTTTAPVGTELPAKADLNVSREQIERALDRVKPRTKAFAGKVSDEVLRTCVG
jgi:hypothetical protein